MSKLSSATRQAVRVLVGGVVLGAVAAGCSGGPDESDGVGTSDQGLAFGGISVPIPGRVEAERFDQGGPNVGYFDTTTGNSGGQFRATDNVDIEVSTPGGFNVGWIVQGEWLAYGVNVASAGSYDLTVSVASLAATGAFHLEVGGANVTGPITFPATGGYQAWTQIKVASIPLPVGQQVIRLVADSSGFNVDWFELSIVARNSDPTCSTGILNAARTACCAASCGSCGGTGCDQRPGGAAACCTSSVTAAGASCSGNLPPCVPTGASTPPTTPPGTSDPSCSTGIRNAEGTVCCAASCGSCGGTACDQRPGGAAACCTGGVTAVGASCSGNLPPCVLTGGPTTPPPGTPPAGAIPAKTAAAGMANGFNLGNTFETNQHPRTTASANAAIDAYYAEGFRTIRIPVKWIASGFADGDLASATGIVNKTHARLGVLQAIVDYAIAKGMFVVVNTHHDDWLFNSPWATSKYTVHSNLWSGICDVFKDRSHRLIFEVMNEPHGSIQFDAAVVRTINQNAYNVIRACGGNNATRNIIIDGIDWGGPSSLQNTWPSVTQIPGGGNDPYLMGSIHFYDPLALTHASSAAGINTAWTTGDIQTRFNNASAWAAGRLPVFVGEFGVNWNQHAHTINTNTFNWYKAVSDQTRARGWAFTVWDDGGWFRVMDRSNRSFNTLQNACVP